MYINEYNSVWELQESLKMNFEEYNTERRHMSLEYNFPDDVIFGRVTLPVAVKKIWVKKEKKMN